MSKSSSTPLFRRTSYLVPENSLSSLAYEMVCPGKLVFTKVFAAAGSWLVGMIMSPAKMDTDCMKKHATAAINNFVVFIIVFFYCYYFCFCYNSRFCQFEGFCSFLHCKDKLLFPYAHHILLFFYSVDCDSDSLSRHSAQDPAFSVASVAFDGNYYRRTSDKKRTLHTPELRVWRGSVHHGCPCCV